MLALVADRGQGATRNLPQGRELLFLAGTRPIVADKLRYDADREFRGDV
ncbi:hypothetical protein [Acidiphilium sp. PM]|nr:hypothetical protein [Acidiphilium sp. PM]EGO93606.1 Conjugal transfer protein TraG [Acidiphilium sp. PM]